MLPDLAMAMDSETMTSLGQQPITFKVWFDHYSVQFSLNLSSYVALVGMLVGQ